MAVTFDWGLNFYPLFLIARFDKILNIVTLIINIVFDFISE